VAASRLIWASAVVVRRRRGKRKCQPLVLEVSDMFL
jgi:hypothetical protein